MKRIIIKKLLILVVAICSTVGTFAFAGALVPFWFGNNFGLNNAPGLFMPNPNIGAPLWGQFLNGGVVPNNNVPFVNPNLANPGANANVIPGAVLPPVGVVPQQNATVNITDAGVDPIVVNLQVNGKVTWKNNTNHDVKIASTGVANGLFTSVIIPGGTYSFTFTHAIVGLTYQVTGAFNGVVNVFGIPAAAQMTDVMILDSGVNPVGVNQPTGTKVTWTNKTTINRKITALNGGLFSSPDIAPGATFSFTFNTVGVWKYQVSDPVAPLIGGVNIFQAPAQGGGAILPPGGVVPQQATVVWLTNNGPFPAFVGKPVGTTVAWRNVSNNLVTITPVAPGGLGLQQFVLPVGGVYVFTFNAQGSVKYSDQNGNFGGVKIF